MRAIALTGFGQPVEIIDLDVPEPAAGEVRVRVHAASVNGFDVAVANGYLNGMMEHRFPVVVGKDFAGVVDAVGEGVTGYQVGDRVFGVVSKAFLGDGSFAEFVTVPVEVGVAKVPDSVDLADAASLGLAGAAAHAAIDAAGVGPGQTVLVAGATGGVGNQVVQLAARAGARVIATALGDQERALVAELGATDIVDHTGDVAAEVRALRPSGVDAVVHLAGEPGAALGLVRPGGRFVSTLLGSPDQLPSEAATVVAVYANPVPETLDRLADDFAHGRTRIAVQRTYPLDDVPAALADFAGGTAGKLLVTLG